MGHNFLKMSVDFINFLYFYFSLSQAAQSLRCTFSFNLSLPAMIEFVRSS